ncbi:MAG TPA: hypothetical protein VIC71_08115 [Gammaproteobacteria bacterium]
MKLRIRGNTLRLRVSKSELATVLKRGAVQDAIRFGPRARLVYRLEVAAGDRFGAELTGDSIVVRAPRAAVAKWGRDDEVSMRGKQRIGGGRTLAILVEKDFECLKPRAGDDATDLFVNPAKTRD